MDVKELPVDDVQIDKGRFQPRSDHNQEKIDALIKNFDETRFNPIRVWRDPELGQYFVLGGHHRLLAFRQMGRETIPVRVFSGTEEAAIEFAMTDNMKSRQQTTAENANYFRKLREQGKTQSQVKQRAKEMLQKNWKAPYDLSLLDRDSSLIVDLTLTSPGTELERELITQGQWVGTVTGQWDLNKEQQNELYRFARANYRTKGKKFTSMAAFNAYVDRVLNQRFGFGEDRDQPLRLEAINPRSPGEQAADEYVEQAREEMEQARKELEQKRKDIERQIARGEDLPVEKVQDVLKPYNDRYTRLQFAYAKAVQTSDDQRKSAKESDIALFGLSDRSPGTRSLSEYVRRYIYA